MRKNRGSKRRTRKKKEKAAQHGAGLNVTYVCRVESVNDQCVSFINEQYCAAQFNLSSAEVDVAIFKAFGKENNNPAKKEKTDIER
jgi:hypothetical protein